MESECWKTLKSYLVLSSHVSVTPQINTSNWSSTNPRPCDLYSGGTAARKFHKYALTIQHTKTAVNSLHLWIPSSSKQLVLEFSRSILTPLVRLKTVNFRRLYNVLECCRTFSTILDFGCGSYIDTKTRVFLSEWYFDSRKELIFRINIPSFLKLNMLPYRPSRQWYFHSFFYFY